MAEISFSEVLRALKKAKFPDCQVVVGIADGGIVPAALVASKKRCALKIMRFNYRNRDNLPRYSQPRLLNTVELPKNINSILLVDDVSISGKTLSAAKRLFKNCKVSTVVLRGKADYVLFPKLTSCVRWPWRV